MTMLHVVSGLGLVYRYSPTLRDFVYDSQLTIKGVEIQPAAPIESGSRQFFELVFVFVL